MYEKFFCAEVRDGFYIPSEVKKAWYCEMEVLKVIDGICKKHHIQYFADYGTLLGAVRHGGFVPWDDDLDIAMLREDYEKFCDIVEEELPEGYSFVNFKNKKDYWYFIARVTNTKKMNYSEAHLKKFGGFPFITGVDIFVLDYVAKDSNREEYRIKLAEYAITLGDRYEEDIISLERLRECVHYLENRLNKKIPLYEDKQKMKKILYIVADELFSCFSDNESDSVTLLMPLGLFGSRVRYSKAAYADSIRMPFENMSVPVPIGFDEVLTMHYGQYMIKIKAGASHGYPYFQAQKDSMRELMGGIYPGDYVVDAQEILSKHTPCMDTHKSDRERNVLFVVDALDHWKYYEKLYQKECHSENTRVSVVLVPMYYKEWDGQLSLLSEKSEGLDSSIRIVPYNEEILKEQYDVIYIQNPYDEYDSYQSIAPAYYSSHLRKIAGELTYVHSIEGLEYDVNSEMDLIVSDYYVCMPGVINADRIVVHNHNIKALYVDKLTSAFGEETRTLWEDKIFVQDDIGI